MVRGALALMGRTDSAAAALSPGNPVAHANLASVLAASGRREEAIEHYQAALRINPGFAPALRGLARLGAAAGDEFGR
jgi:tetratricopeptide (TPR) repeat protein